MKPLISVIIPVYNSARHLEPVIMSVLEQTWERWELILVDDGSTDASYQICEKFLKSDDRIKFFSRPKERAKGGNACRNYGFERSNGNFINWFDSDDIMHPEMLESKIRSISGTNYDFVVSEGLEFKETIENVVRKWDNLDSKSPILDHALGKIAFHTNGPLFRREFLSGKRLFDETLQRKQEWEFYTRLLNFYPKYGVIRKPLFYYRRHEDSINGRNDPLTIKSRVKADIMVFKTVKNSGVLSDMDDFEIRKLFFLKILQKKKMAISSGFLGSAFYAMVSMMKLCSPRFLKTGAVKVLEKPKIISNLISKN